MNTYRNRSLLIIAIFCCLSISSIVTAQINQTTLDFSKAWFKPFLTENKDPVCDSLLAISQHEFFSTQNSQHPSDNNLSGPIQNTQDWTLQVRKENEPNDAPYFINNKKVYVQEFHGHGCGGACETAYMAASNSPFPYAGGYGEELSLHENQMTNSVPAYEYLLGLYLHKNGSFYLITTDEFTQAYKIKPDATLDKVCVISNKPTQEFTPPSKKNKCINCVANCKNECTTGRRG